MERSWPRLAAALGESFRPRFEAWAQANPMELEASPLVDGRRFADALLAEGGFPDAARDELLTFEVRHRLTGQGLVARRGLTLKSMRAGRSRLLTARLPGGHVLRFRIPAFT